MIRVFQMLLVVMSAVGATADDAVNQPPPGFEALFDGESLDGWHGLVGNPLTRAEMSDDQLAAARQTADEETAKHWRIEDGEIINDGSGPHLCTDQKYANFELWIDWKLSPGSDSGIYLRGSPQVQIWDPFDGIDAAKVGSGGLYNNQLNISQPLVRADRPTGEWNTFYIRMIGERVTVFLNDQLVTHDVIMENYWDRERPIFAKEQIELQTHGGEIRFRNIFIREIDIAETNRSILERGNVSLKPIFNGHDLDGWVGSTDGYVVEDGTIVCDPEKGGNLFTEHEYGDFVLRFEFKLTPGANNGLAIRAPLEGNPAYAGMELQILDNSAAEYTELQPYQYHGSVYGVLPAMRGYLRILGEWNVQEVICRGSHIIVRLNGFTIVNVDLATIEQPMDGQDHPGLKRKSGHIGFMGHGHRVQFRNLMIGQN